MAVERRRERAGIARGHRGGVGGVLSATDADVLIAGAGPAGSAAAVHLAQAGWRVVVVDRAEFPRDKPCSEYMSPEAVRLLDRLGVVPDLEAAGAVALEGTTVIAARGSRLTGLFREAEPRPFRPAGLSLPRRILDARLVRAAREAGADVRERTRLEALLHDGGAVAGAMVRGPDGRHYPIRARLTIGADGLGSLVARRLGRRHSSVPRRVAFVAHVRGVAGMGPTAEMHVGDAGYVGLNRIGADLYNVALVVPQAACGDRPRSGDTSSSSRRSRPSPGSGAASSLRRLEREVLVTGPFAARAGRVTAGGALLVGDAADFFDPFTGQGIYSALRGAEMAAAHRLRRARAERHRVRRGARALPAAAPAGLCRQVGRRTADRVRHAPARALRPRRRPARPAP